MSQQQDEEIDYEAMINEELQELVEHQDKCEGMVCCHISQ